MRVSSTKGVTLAVHDLGGEGPPFLIAHATGMCGRAYEPLAAVLAPHFHVHAIDFRATAIRASPRMATSPGQGWARTCSRRSTRRGRPDRREGHSLGERRC